MGPGQFRRLIVPPDYAFGNVQVQEMPPNATVTADPNPKPLPLPKPYSLNPNKH